jgi:hypothetical protein
MCWRVDAWSNALPCAGRHPHFIYYDSEDGMGNELGREQYEYKSAAEVSPACPCGAVLVCPATTRSHRGGSDVLIWRHNTSPPCMMRGTLEGRYLQGALHTMCMLTPASWAFPCQLTLF